MRGPPTCIEHAARFLLPPTHRGRGCHGRAAEIGGLVFERGPPDPIFLLMQFHKAIFILILKWAIC